MAASPGKPAVQFVAKGGCVRNGYEQSPMRIDHSCDLAQSTRQIVEVFEAMIRYHSGEDVVRERQARGIALHNKFIVPGYADFPVHANHPGRCAGGIETARRAAQIEDSRR